MKKDRQGRFVESGLAIHKTPTNHDTKAVKPTQPSPVTQFVAGPLIAKGRSIHYSVGQLPVFSRKSRPASYGGRILP